MSNKLYNLWDEYSSYKSFTKDILPPELYKSGSKVTFMPDDILINIGDFPEYVYFIISGEVKGVRPYADGTNYHYFNLNERSGTVGLLEVFSYNKKSVATIVANTKVVALKISSDVIYKAIMNDIALLRRCLFVISSELYVRSSNDGILYYKKGIDRIKFFLIRYYSSMALEKECIAVQVDYLAISNNVGVSVRTVGRSLQKLKQQKLIGCKSKQVTITYDQFQCMCSDLQF